MSAQILPMSGMVCYVFTVNGGADDTAGVSGALPTGKKILDLRMVKPAGVPWNTYRGGGARFSSHYNGVPGIVAAFLFSKDAEPFPKRLQDKRRQHLIQRCA